MAAGTAVGLGSGTVRAQADGLETAALAPDTALIYLSLSLDTESEQWAQADALLDRLGIESIEDAMASAGESATSSDMAGPEEFETFLGGEVGLVITNLEAAQEAGAELSGEAGLPGVTGARSVGTPVAAAAGEAEGIALIAKPVDVAAAWTTVAEQLAEDAAESGQSVTEEDYQGVTISSVAADEAADASGTAAAQVADFIVISSTAADVQAIVDVQQGNAGALADDEHFQELAGAFTDPRLAFIYVNGPALLAQAMAGADMAQLGELGRVGELLTGSFNVYSATVVSAQPEGFRFDSLALPGEDGALPPLPANFDPALPDKVPSNTVLFVDGGDLGASNVLDTIALLFIQSLFGADSAATPAPIQSAEEYAAGVFEQTAQLFGFNLQTDFIDQMVGEYALALWGVETLDPTQINALFVTGVGDAATFNDAVAKINLLIQGAAQGQVSITTRQVGTDTINVVDLSATGAPVTVEYGVVGNEFVLGVNNGVTVYTEGPADPLSANPTYQGALAALPAEHNSIFYLDLSQLVPLFETFSGAMTVTSEDASEKCAEYASQEDAQAAYDADTATNWELDLDFDGTACEDFFAPASPEAAAVQPDLSKLTAFAVVGYQQDGMTGASGILVIAE